MKLNAEKSILTLGRKLKWEREISQTIDQLIPTIPTATKINGQHSKITVKFKRKLEDISYKMEYFVNALTDTVVME